MGGCYERQRWLSGHSNFISFSPRSPPPLVIVRSFSLIPRPGLRGVVVCWLRFILFSSFLLPRARPAVADAAAAAPCRSMRPRGELMRASLRHGARGLAALSRGIIVKYELKNGVSPGEACGGRWSKMDEPSARPRGRRPLAAREPAVAAWPARRSAESLDQSLVSVQ